MTDRSSRPIDPVGAISVGVEPRFGDRSWLSLTLTAMVILLSPDVSAWLGYQIPTGAGIEILPVLLGAVIFAYCGLPFLRGAVAELRDRRTGKMALVSMSMVVVLAASLAGTLGALDVDGWWQLAMLVTVLLLGQWLEMRGSARVPGLVLPAAPAVSAPAGRGVSAAASPESRAHALADATAAFVFYAALAAAAATLVAGWSLGDAAGAFMRAATVLVIASPTALRLAVPLVEAIATSLGARSGLLLDATALAKARRLDIVIFDKTGALTKGQPVLVGVVAAPWIHQADLLGLAASVEAGSEHPLARAILRGARERGIEPAEATSVEALDGRGVRAVVFGRVVAVGGPRLLAELGVRPPAGLGEDGWASAGASVLHVLVDGQVAGALALEDEIRPESHEAVERLHALGIRAVMITGDSLASADSVAARLGIDEIVAQVLPADKAAAVRRLRSGGRRVAMVGNRFGDGPALAAADVGISIGAGAGGGVEPGGIVIVGSDPRSVGRAVTLSRAAHGKAVQNVILAAAYNLVAIPVAAGVLAPWGIGVPVVVGAVAMTAATIIVTANAQLIRGLRLGPSADLT